MVFSILIINLKGEPYQIPCSDLVLHRLPIPKKGFKVVQRQFSLNPFPAINNNCHQLSHLLMYLVSNIANNIDPDHTTTSEQSTLGS